MQNSNVKTKLIVLSFLQFAVWGAYLTSMGRYLGNAGMGSDIGWFYSVQGIVSIFMPAIIGIIADRWVPAQRLLGFSHAIAALFMGITGYMGVSKGAGVEFNDLFWTYTISVAFYMPTLALSNSVSYTALTKAGLDTVKAFPPIRVFGTVGFIVSMWIVDLTGFQNDYSQFFASAVWGALLAAYSFTLPNCPVNKSVEKKSFSSAFGLDAFKLFNQRKMAMFFIFSMLLGAALQVSNGFANTFISSFAADKSLADTFAVQHTNMLISLSQISETLCILLIPFFLKRFGIKIVMFIAMLGWVFRFGFFAVGDPGMPGVLLFVLSMIVYGVAFDFFNVSGSLFVDKEVPESMRSSAQGLFMLMTNGLGASIGVIAAQKVVDKFTHSVMCIENGKEVFYTVGDWSSAWYIFAGYALVIALLFAILFKDKKAAKV
ncbi:MAG: MFS transporter [Bacteroidaceae bacterium]|nr:MFS transporter [Bacteroidaceae bacterium]